MEGAGNFIGASAGSGGWLLSLLAFWLLLRCVRSMLGGKYRKEVWGFLEAGGARIPLESWECVVGSDRGCDVVAAAQGVERNHAVLLRSDRGVWTLWDLEGGVTVDGTREDEGEGVPLEDGSEIRIGEWSARFIEGTEEEDEGNTFRFIPSGGPVSQGRSLVLLTSFQFLLMLKYVLHVPSGSRGRAALTFFALMAAEWALFLLMRLLRRKNFEVETLAFFLCTLGAGLGVSTGTAALAQLVQLSLGVGLFLALGWWLRNLARTNALRPAVGTFSLMLLLFNVAVGVSVNGASNWLQLGPLRFQPSEMVKLAYIYVGSAPLDRLYTKSNLFWFLIFSALCVLALALMGDFGTALVFFTAFLVIAFLRSGSFGTVLLSLAGAGIAGSLVILVRPHVAARFAVWGHVWEDPYNAGWQQTRALSAAARGGLTGVGAGRGWLKNIFAADTDLAFCMVSEELGLIIAVCAVLAVAALALFSLRSAARARSSGAVIAACAAASVLVVQLALNVFGSTDLLPFTGVTFPFVSRGGSSLVSCWGMLAFLKAADTRPGASFSVPTRRLRPKPERSRNTGEQDKTGEPGKTGEQNKTGEQGKNGEPDKTGESGKTGTPGNPEEQVKREAER